MFTSKMVRLNPLLSTSNLALEAIYAHKRGRGFRVNQKIFEEYLVKLTQRTYLVDHQVEVLLEFNRLATYYFASDVAAVRRQYYYSKSRLLQEWGWYPVQSLPLARISKRILLRSPACTPEFETGRSFYDLRPYKTNRELDRTTCHHIIPLRVTGPANGFWWNICEFYTLAVLEPSRRQLACR
mmetsp:Transcript_12355/g.50736  ORF Transcript_12355/g.50736 Transcript_12355/m.50736 type:complete len:183 (-) Transcript_12355:449-997(-)